MKKLMSVLLTAILSMSSLVCFAAPASLDPVAQSTSSNLIVITNPPSISSTTQKGVVFCGYGESGVKVTFYKYNPLTGLYYPMTSNGNSLSLDIVYQSGLFWKKIDFSAGNHKVIVYAEKGDRVQIVKREINVLSPGIADNLFDYTLNFRPAYK